MISPLLAVGVDKLHCLDGQRVRWLAAIWSFCTMISLGSRLIFDMSFSAAVLWMTDCGHRSPQCWDRRFAHGLIGEHSPVIVIVSF